jgi:hypothetical protein
MQFLDNYERFKNNLGYNRGKGSRVGGADKHVDGLDVICHGDRQNNYYSVGRSKCYNNGRLYW